MAETFDSDNLMYVSKHYENEVKNKAKQIYASDEVAITIDNINKQLNDILLEMDNKLDFINNKIGGENGVDAYLQGVHTQIDNVEVNHDSLVSDDIKNTTSHPSIVAFKSDRNETKYNTYDFINKSLSITHNSPELKINGKGQIDDETPMHTFIFNTDDREYLKIIEFSFTYKQYPDIISIKESYDSNNELVKEVVRTPTVSVNRIISGKFFLIRHDPIEHPDQFIIKAIIKNSDNTGNIIDKKIIDIKEFKENGSFSYILDDGPQFDIYFKFIDNSYSGLKIYVSKVIPYRYIMEKKYVNTGDEAIVNFEISDTFNGKSNLVDSQNIEDVYYSKVCGATFIVDKTNGMISFTDTSSLSNKISLATTLGFEAGTLIEDFWVKDVGNYCFLKLKTETIDTLYVTQSSVSHILNLNKSADDVVELSSGEIVVLHDRKYYYFNTDSGITTSIFVDTSDIDSYENFRKISKLVELDDRLAIVFITSPSGIYFKVKEKNVNSGLYYDTLGSSYGYKLDTTEYDGIIENLNPTTSKIDVIKSAAGIFIAFEISDGTDSVSLIMFVNNLIKTGISYNFKVQTILNLFNNDTYNSSTYNEGFKKLVSTSLFNFLISKNNKLYIIDEKRIVKALKFTETAKGWTDKDSVLYMNPETNQEEYYLCDNAYLQSVQDIFETPNGIFISDNEGVYLLEASKNLVCEYFVSNNSKVIKYLPIYNRDGTIGSLYVDNDYTVNNNKKYSIYTNNYATKRISSKKLRYKYLDLFKNDYQLFENENTEYDEERPIIDFKATLYCSFVDHLSPIYNINALNNISYTHFETYGEIKDSASKYTLSTNKYGFLKYDNYLTLDKSNLNKISDINEVKRIKISHSANDNVTYREVIENIHAIIAKEYEDMKYTTIPNVDVTYSPDWDREDVKLLSFDEIQSHQRLMRTGEYEIIETKYGLYYVEQNVNNGYYNFYYQSIFNGERTNLPSLSTNNTVTDFNVAELNDNLDTVFISESNKLFRTNGRDNNGNFQIPFSVNNSDHPIEAMLVGNVNLEYVRKYDGVVYAWGKSLPGIYEYSSISKAFLKNEQLGDYTNIIDMIKIGSNFHIFYVGADDKIHYEIRGNKTVTIDLTSIQLNNSSNLSTVNKIKIYNFKKCPIVYIVKSEHEEILKYDSELDQFVSSIVFKYPFNPNYSNAKFGEFDDKIYISRNDPKTGLGIYDFENDYIELVDSPDCNYFFRQGSPNSTEYPFGRFMSTMYCDKFNTISAFDRYLGDSNNNGNYTSYFLSESEKPIVTFDSRINDGNDIFNISRPIINEVEINDNQKYNNFDILTLRDEYRNSYRTLTENEKTAGPQSSIKYYTKMSIDGTDVYTKVPNESVDFSSNNTYYVVSEKHIGRSNFVQSFDTPWHICSYNEAISGSNAIGGDTGNGSINFENMNWERLINTVTETYNPLNQYYLLDGVNTPMSPILVDVTTFENVEQRYDHIIEATEVETELPEYEEIDLDIIKNPIPTFIYYVLEINGSYTSQHGIKEFDPLKRYFIKKHNFKVVKNGDSYNPNAKYFIAEHLALKPISETLDLNIDLSTNQKSFKSTIQYFEYVTFDKKKAYIRSDYMGVMKTIERNQKGYDNKSLYNGLLFILTDGVLMTSAVYRFTEREILCNSSNNALFAHKTIIPLMKIWNTKFGNFAIGVMEFANDIRELVFVRLSSDFKTILDIYGNYGFDNNGLSKIDLYETKEYLFLANNVENNTYMYNDTTKTFSHLVFGNALRNIFEYEDGSIYGMRNDTNVLTFYKFDTSNNYHFSLTDTVSYNDSLANLKCVQRTNKNGNIETYFYGVGSTKNNIYKFCENKIEPALVNNPIHYSTFDFVNSVNNILYFTKLPPNEHMLNNKLSDRTLFCNPDVNDGKDYGYLDETIVGGINTNEIENYIGEVFPKYDKTILFIDNISTRNNFNDNYSLFKIGEIGYSQNPMNFTLSDRNNYGYGVDTNAKYIMNNDNFIPLVDKNGVIYYKECVSNYETMMPDYTKRYKIFDTDEETLISSKPKFDKLYMTSLGIFGFIGSQTYLNRIYDNNENFIKIKSTAAIVGNDNSIKILETQHGIFISYGTLLARYNEDLNQIDILFEGDESAQSLEIMNNDDNSYSKGFHWYSTKPFLLTNKNDYSSSNFITSDYFDDIYFVFYSETKQSDVFYKYDHATKTFVYYYEHTGSNRITNIADTRIGIFICDNTTSFFNLQSKTSTETSMKIRDIYEDYTGRIYALPGENNKNALLYSYFIWNTSLGRWIPTVNTVSAEAFVPCFPMLTVSTLKMSESELVTFSLDSDGVVKIKNKNGSESINLIATSSNKDKYRQVFGFYFKTYPQNPSEFYGCFRYVGVGEFQRNCVKDYLSNVPNEGDTYFVDEFIYGNENDALQTIMCGYARIDDVEFFLDGYGHLYMSGWKLKRYETEIKISNRRITLPYQFEFIGKNTSKWDNYAEDVDLTMKNKFVYRCIGEYYKHNSNDANITDYYDERIYDYNNYIDDLNDIDGLAKLYKEMYITNDSKRKSDIIFAKNKTQVNNLNPLSSPYDVLDDVSIFDNQDFDIELTLYKASILRNNISETEAEKDVPIKILRPYDSKNIFKNRHCSYLTYDPFYSE